MALTAKDALKKAAEKFFREREPVSVGELDKRIATRRGVIQQRPGWEIELSFNEAAGVLAVSTAQLESLLEKHPPEEPLFEVKGAKKRTCKLSALMDWADVLKAKGFWAPLLARGASPDALLTDDLPFVVLKSRGGGKPVFLKPLGGGTLSEDLMKKAAALLERELGIVVCSLSTALKEPWLDEESRVVWRDAYSDALDRQAAALMEAAHRLRETKAQVMASRLDRAWEPVQPIADVPEGGRL